MSEIRQLRESNDGGNNDTPSLSFSKSFQEKILSLLVSSVPANDFAHSQKTFQTLLWDKSARFRLDSLHAARAYKYGSAQFGPKNWYKESQYLAKRLKTQTDRRKFRHGLKADIEFVFFFNLNDVEELLESGDSGALKLLNLDESMKPSELFAILHKVPMMALLKLWNTEKAGKLKNIIQKISDALHFSFSMTDYFAQDDALEPALAVVCQMLRTDHNLGSHLRLTKSSFLSLAQCFQKHRSSADKDFCHKQSRVRAILPRLPAPLNDLESTRNSLIRWVCVSIFSGKKVARARCRFAHESNNCGSGDHGVISCPNEG